MLRAFNAGISGMNTNQTKLDVTSGNIANSSTVAYKSESVNNSDSFSETISDATGSSKNLGGTNAKQITLGTQVSSISTNIQKGSLNPTGRNLDCAIDGEGQYFIVATGPTMFSEQDCVKVDSNNHSITTVPTGVAISYTRDGSFQLDSEGNLLTSDGHRVLGYSMMGRNQIASGANDYADAVSISRAQGESTANIGAGSSVIEESGENITSIDQANSLVIGRASAATTGAASSYIAEGDVAFVNYDDNDLRADSSNLHSLKIPDSVRKFYKGTDGKVYVKSVKVKNFSVGTDGTITASLDDNTTAALGQIAMATFKNPEGLTKSGSNLLDVSANSGEAIIRYGAAKDPQSKNANEAAYKNSIKSKDNSAGFSDIKGGCLEESNVDLAKEFTNMIIATRGFQASSKVISTGDEILQTLVNLVK
ncbi:flagellar hook-basal body complex protein [Clostridium neuense]|uniref:Flagellar hook protein FlgE n=1 Tax=Clostridium neuense TaxID=1728934 RepID=A0ABW8TH63_9CLOT